jgi:hypothetical protein
MRALSLIAALAISFTAYADTVQLREDAPDRHVVVKGDTLWDISAKFLKTPWKWPELWRLNQEEIKNPHLIYPGDVILLTWVDGKPQLSKLESVRLSPEVRSEAIDGRAGISSVPYKAIAPFLQRTRVIEAAKLDNMPFVLGGNHERVMYSTHDKVYATPGDGKTTAWQIVRVGRPLADPDTGAILGYQLDHLADGETVKAGAPQLVQITAADKEVLERDRLVPATQMAAMNLAPHAPEKAVNAKVITSLSGIEGVGSYATVVLNKGAGSGLEAGHVLALYRSGRSTADPNCLRAEKLAFIAGGHGHRDTECNKQAEATNRASLPDEHIGLAFIYRVYDSLAFALIMNSTEPVYPGTLARNPE